MTTKDAVKEIKELLNSGAPKSEVFKRFSGGSLKDASLAATIGSWADPQLCVQHRYKIRVLVFILCALAVFNGLTGYFTEANSTEAVSGIFHYFHYISAVLFVLWARGVYNNNAGAYTTFIFLNAYEFPQRLKLILPYGAPIGLVEIGTIVGWLTLIAYVWYLKTKLFPGLGIFQQMKKNREGKYIFAN